MRSRLALRRFVLVPFVVVVAGSAYGGAGCGADTSVDEPSAHEGEALTPAAESREAVALRLRFPEQAQRVLDADQGFAATAGGFVPAPQRRERPALAALAPPVANGMAADRHVTLAPAPSRTLRARLPERGEDAVRFELPDGFSAHVHETGASGEGMSASRAVAYARAGGTSFWTVTDAGYEEWLWLDRTATSGEGPTVTWRIEGADLRQTGDRIQLIDDAGHARIDVTAPEAYAVGGERVAVRLVAGDATIELWVDARDQEVLIDPSWVPTGAIPHAHAFQSSSLLPDGRLLLAAGWTGTTWQFFSETYDPATNLWSPAASALYSRAGAQAALLLNGKVIVVGGYDGGSSCLAPTELYDAATNTWATGPSLTTGRCMPTIATLANGKVLVAGGLAGSTVTQSAELYDAASNTWSSAGAMATGRLHHSMTLLSNGKVLAAGGAIDGSFATSTATAELYDPASNTWSSAGSMPSNRFAHAATLLSNGKVLVTGGSPTTGNSVATAATYEPSTNTWSPVSSMITARRRHTAVLLPSGVVLVAAGTTNGTSAIASAETYDPSTNLWTATVPLAGARFHQSGVLLGNGKVILAGGTTSGSESNATNALATAEVFTGSLMIGAPCTGALDCQSGFCVDGVCCNTACSGGSCDACSIAAGAPSNGTCFPFTGTPCNDGNSCTQTDTCQSGTCTGTDPVVCPPAGVCFAQGTCDPATGICSKPVAPNGTPCDDSNACTNSDTCQAGTCTGGSPTICTALDQCHLAGVCHPVTGCNNPPKADGSLCNDGNECLQTDLCQAGTCVGSNPVTCTPADTCHDPGLCNPLTGQCSSVVKPDGAACSDSNACTQTDTCLGGVCQGSNPLACPPPATCQEPGTCNPLNGACSYPIKADGKPCDDSSACTSNDLCTAGICTGSTTVTCTAQDECHDAGTCDPGTGQCSSPSKADGTPCAGGVCTDGVCGPVSSTSSTGAAGGGTGSGGSGGGTGSGGSGGTATGTGTGTGSGGGSSTTAAGSGGNGTSGGANGDPTDSGGCGCRTSGSAASGGLPAVLALMLLRLRRRRTKLAA